MGVTPLTAELMSGCNTVGEFDLSNDTILKMWKQIKPEEFEVINK